MKLQIQLLAAEPGSSVQQFEVPFSGNSVVIGRGPESPVPLEGARLSRNHVAFGVSGGQLTLTDLSSNGVWINAQSVPKNSPIALAGSEEIVIPGYRLRVRLLLPAPPTPALPETDPGPAPEAARATAVHAQPASLARSEASAAPDTGETLSGDPEEPLEAAPIIPWWHLSSMERVVLVFVLLTAGLFAYYYSIL